MQTRPDLVLEGGEEGGIPRAYEHIGDTVASCKVSGVPHGLQTDPHLIKWFVQTTTQKNFAVFHLTMLNKDDKTTMCSHHVALTAHFISGKRHPAFNAISKLHDYVYHGKTKTTVFTASAWMHAAWKSFIVNQEKSIKETGNLHASFRT